VVQDAPVQNPPVQEWGPVPARRAAGGGATLCLALLWVAWFVLPLVLVLVGFAEVFTLDPVGTTEAQQADARSMFVRAGIAAVLIAVLGLGVSLYAQRRVGAIAFGCAVVLSVGAALVVGVAAARAAPDETPPRGPVVCQERSGGDNDCPGG
jgi:hypothetical protein